LSYDQAGQYKTLAEKCAAVPDMVSFEQGVRLPIPTEVGKGVRGHFDAVAGGTSVEAMVYLAENSELVTSLNDVSYGDAEAAAQAEEVAETSLPGVKRDSGTGPKKAAVEKWGAFAEPFQEKLRTQSTAKDAASLLTATAAATSVRCSSTAPHGLDSPHPLLGTNEGGYQRIDFYYNDANQPAVYTDAQYRARVSNSIAKWDLIGNECGIDAASSLPNYDLHYMGITSATSGISADFKSCTQPTKNVIDWKYSSIDTNFLAGTCAFFGIGSAPATTGTQINRRYLWFAESNINNCDPSGIRNDLSSVLIHELSHSFGLKHTASSFKQVTSENAGRCNPDSRFLGRGDIRGVQARYGKGYWWG